MDIINRIKRYSQSLDAKAIVCNKTWDVFNDNGVKETYIFQDNGNLIISNNGIVTDGKWEFIPANKSLIIRGNGQSYMLHPEFYDGIIFALKLDGTPECSFMINEANVDSFVPKSKQDLISYFEEIERKQIEITKEQTPVDDKYNSSVVFIAVVLLIVALAILAVIVEEMK